MPFWTGSLSHLVHQSVPTMSNQLHKEAQLVSQQTALQSSPRAIKANSYWSPWLPQISPILFWNRSKLAARTTTCDNYLLVDPSCFCSMYCNIIVLWLTNFLSLFLNYYKALPVSGPPPSPNFFRNHCTLLIGWMIVLPGYFLKYSVGLNCSQFIEMWQEELF